MKKNIKQILSFILVSGMMLGVLPTALPTEVSAETSGATELFNGNATYLLQERFNGPMGVEFSETRTNSVLSGWDVDYRGGNVHVSGNDAVLTDFREDEGITLSHKIMKHTGDGLVLETAFKYVDIVKDGFYYEISGDGATSLKLIVENGYICVEQAGGKKTQTVKCSAGTFYHIKAKFTTSTKKIDLWINGKSVGRFSYLESAQSIDEIKLGTTDAQLTQIALDYVCVYVNYIVNETFMAAPAGSVPAWWTATGGSVAAVPGAPYPADPNGFSLPSSESLAIEHDVIWLSEDGDKYSISWEMLVPSGGADGFRFANGIRFEVENGWFYIGNEKPVYKYTNNVWYKIELQVSYGSIDVYINNVKRATCNSSIDVFIDLSFYNGSSSTVMLDNIRVYKTFEASDYEDYPTVDEVVTSDTSIGMIFYPMWREGTHYGWDLITPYEDRTPYLGYYTGGSPEVTDWDNKWLLEHGFDHAIYPFARPDINSAGGQPSFSVRGEALHDGYMNSVYKDQLDFAIMITNPLDAKYDSAEDFITNVEPYLVEHYFKNPSYKSINNRLLVYNYNAGDLATYLGGMDKLNTVLESLNTAVQKIDNQNGGKYDGITFISDVSSSGDAVNSLISNYSFGPNVLKWHYTWGSDKYENIANGIKTEYAGGSNSVASIPMGFDNTPWKYNEIGIISPDGIQSICDTVVANKGSDDPNIVVFTCWDEWGEGHFFSPSNIHGFDYLNVVRDTFTSGGTKTDEDRPTENAKKRMGVLFPEDRQILKIKKDRVEYTADDLASLTSLGKKSLKLTPVWSPSNATIGYSNGAYNYTITGSPATVTYDISSLGIDASKITAIRINGYAQNSSTMVLYSTTTANSNMNNTDFRFEGKCDGGTTVTDTILFPDNPDKLTGTLKQIRFNPTANTSNGSKFSIYEIEFYTGKISTTVTVDTKEIDLVSPVAFSDTAYLPAYKLLLDLDAYVLWDKTTKTLTAEKDGVIVKLTAGSKTMSVNGTNKTLSYAPYYSEGNLFIPYSGVLEEFGYTVLNDTKNNNIDIRSKNYNAMISYENNGRAWYFNIDGYAEGWTAQNAYLDIRNGMVGMYSKTKDPILTIDGLDIPKSEALYAIVRIKKTDSSETGMIRLYDDSTNATGVIYKFSLKPSNEVQEFVFDLTKDATIDSVYTNTYDALSKITKLRLDPMDNYGCIYIDSIVITDTLPDKDFAIEAYSFETANMLQFDTAKTKFAYTNTLNSEGSTSSSILPVTETVDGYDSVIKVVPTSGASEGLFTLEEVYYNGSKQSVDAVCSDERIVKVSFWYKGIGNCTALRFENRQGGSRDGEEFLITDISNSEWKYFEDYIDMSNETASNRWFALRVTTGGNTAQDGIYLRDYKLVCLDEETPITTTSGETVAVCINKLNGDIIVDEDTAKVYFAEYGADGKMNTAAIKAYPNIINVLNNGSTTTEPAKYYYLKPSSDASEIKCFFWDNGVPMAEGLTITNN